MNKGFSFIHKAWAKIPSLKIKLITIISAIVFVSLTLLIYIALGIFQNNMENMVTFVNSKSTKLLSERVEAELDAKIASLEAYSTINHTIANRPDSFFKTHNNLLFAGKLGSDGRVISSHANPLSQDEDRPSKRTIIAKKIEIQNLAKKSLQRPLIIKNVSHLFEYPVLLIQVVKGDSASFGLFDLKDLYNLFAGDATEKSIYTSFLVDETANLIVHPKKEWMLTETSFNEHPLVKSMFSGESANRQIHYNHNDSSEFGAYFLLGGYGLGVASVIPEKIAMEGVDIVRTGSLLITLTILCVASLFVYLFSKTISTPVQELAEAAREIQLGKYDMKVTPRGKDEVGRLTLAFNNMAEGLGEREKLKGALGKFVNEEIANQALSGNLSLGGKRNHCTIFFSDIRSFTAISEKLEPEEVVEFLNEYMTLMVDIIHSSGGVVDKFIGDAIMAIWGAPVSKGNDEERCVRAALEMRNAMLKFNAKREKAGKPLIRIGCGINTGYVISGQIGSEDRLEYTVIGDAVNLASRVETLCKPFAADILISENTYQKVKDIVNVSAMDKILVKGKEKPQQVYAVLGLKKDSKSPKNIQALRKITGLKLPPKSNRNKGEKFATVKK